MNLKKTIYSIILIGMFVTGCSKNNIKEPSKIADEETHQKTMTKVQNNANEIIGKDYDYVLKNMGVPYCTTYYIDAELMESANTIDELNKIVTANNMRLIYPKYTSDNELDGSALYIEINNYKVIGVQTYEFSDYDIETEAVRSNVDIIVDQYNEKITLPIEKFKNIDFKNYIHKDKKELYSLLDEDSSNFEAYDKERKEKIKGYFLKENDGSFKNVLTIYEKDNLIESIDIVSADKTMNVVKSHLYNNK
ncbi:MULTISPECIES: hypothetical protein [Clostridia]|uniref:hypothetical protein n=1 Tax=Clostridium sp. CCUG 7971 TaxID=2811414 RepID=UPI001ABAF705|nr:hypothetical protein [Clostridium sp. CCUG 7971]MBO3445711.1 hypothetical protein [Clostridium sp. CCUG 7971]